MTQSELARERVLQKPKLNLGCGEDIRADYTNIDLYAIPGIDIIADAVNLPFVDSDCVDYIVLQHVLEFIPRNMLLIGLREWHRILKVGCHIEIRVTDIEAVTKALYLQTVSKEMGIAHEMVIALLYGKQERQYDVRVNGFTAEFLQGILYGAGFSVQQVTREDFDVIISARKE